MRFTWPRVSLTFKIVAWTLALSFLYISLLTWFSFKQISEAVRLSEESSLMTEHIRYQEDTNRSLEQAVQLVRTLRSLPRMSPRLRDQILGRIGEAGQDWIFMRVYQVRAGRPIPSLAAVREAAGLDELRQVREWEQRLIAARFNFAKVSEGQLVLQRIQSTDDISSSFIVLGRPLTRANDGSIAEFGVVVLSPRLLERRFTEDRSKRQALVNLIETSVLVSSVESSAEELNGVLSRLGSASSATQQFMVQIGGVDHVVSASEISDQIWGFTALPESVISIPVRESFRWNLALGLAILAIGISASVGFTLHFTRPIEILSRILSRVGRGEFDTRASEQVRTGDEIEFLARSVDQMTSGLKERDKVKSLFQKFHGTEVTEDLMNREISLGGQLKDVVVFFSDIRGFTSMSERLAPEAVVRILNRYFSRMVKVISSHGGVVDKFVGDAIMAVWGLNKMDADTTRMAYRACLEMRRELEALNREFEAEGLPVIQIGMGLHRGAAIVGTLGSEDRMEFTSIGDTINTAARVESMTKEYKTDLLITQAIFECLENEPLENLGEIALKGKTNAVRLYGTKAA